MRTVTPEQKERATQRREKFRGLVKQVAAMSDEQRTALADSLAGLVTCEGHALSFHNTCLVASQCPTATIVGGFRQWLRHGRCVAKGQHGLMIWVPIKGRSKNGPADNGGEPMLGVDTTEHSETWFVAGTVFDILQTIEIGPDSPEQNEAITEHAGNLAVA